MNLFYSSDKQKDTNIAVGVFFTHQWSRLTNNNELSILFFL